MSKIEIKVHDEPKSAESNQALVSAMQRMTERMPAMIETHVNRAVAAHLKAHKPVKEAKPAPVVVNVENKAAPAVNHDAHMARMTRDLTKTLTSVMKQSAKPVVQTRTIVKQVKPDMSPVTRAISNAMRKRDTASKDQTDKTGTVYVKQAIAPYVG